MARTMCQIIISLLCVLTVTTVTAQLRIGYYQSTCPLAELIITQEVFAAFLRDTGKAAGLIRLHFHDCFVRGCDWSVLIESTTTNKAEKDAKPNNPSLRGFEIIDNAKTKIEAICPGIVSCADIVAFAARDSIQLTGGIVYNVPVGRKDGRVSVADEVLAELPNPFMDVNALTQAFASKGFSQEEMIILSGAHTLGRSHCSSINNRLYNPNGTSNIDPTLDQAYAAQLQQQCPPNDTSLTIPMDPLSPAFLDSTGYYNAVLGNRGLFASDQTLISTPETKAHVIQNAQNQFIWAQKFTAAMIKMGNISVLTENAGEVRANCRVINPED